MQFKRHIKPQQYLEPVAIVPLINIIFLLLIFFMFSSTLATRSGIRVNLPFALTSEVAKYENIEIILSGENITYFNGKVVAAAELVALLKQAALRNQSVLIKADKSASLGRVVEIWDKCRNSGVTQVNIATGQ